VRTLIFDIESDNLYYDVTKVHCIRAYHVEEKTMLRFDKDTQPLFKGIQELNEGLLVGHNIVNYDIPALHKLYPKFNWKNRQVFDTMLMSKLVCADIVITDLKLLKEGILPSKLYGSHSLKAWGYRLGFHKGTYATEIEHKRIGKTLKQKFMLANPTLAKLITTIKGRAKERSFVYDLDGNKLYSRSNHSAPNLLFQSCGAILMKYWAVRVDEKLQALGLKNSFDDKEDCDYEFILNVHDEAQTETKESLRETIMKIKEETFGEIGEFLKINIRIDGEAKSGLNWSDTH